MIKDIDNKLTWSYEEKVKDFVKPEVAVLNMSNNKKDFAINALFERGLVKTCDSKTLPYEDKSFKLIINRESEFDLNEVHRCLMKNGYFITEQIGGSDFFSPSDSMYNLENVREEFIENGFRVLYQNQCYPELSFKELEKDEQEKLKAFSNLKFKAHRFIIIAKKVERENESK